MNNKNKYFLLLILGILFTAISCGKISLPATEFRDPSEADASPGFTITSDGSLLTHESGTSYTMYLRINTRPLKPVELTLSSFMETEALVEPANISFNEDNWKEPVIITVTGMDDFEADGDQNFDIVFSPSKSKFHKYNGIQVDAIAGVNADDETAGIVVSAPSGNLLTNEKRWL